MTARKTLPLFSLFLLSIFIGCGGNFVPPSQAASSHTQNISAADVFSNIAETWTFKDGKGCLMFIDVQPVDATHTVWHYHKNCAGAYWAPNVPAAELSFDLKFFPSDGVNPAGLYSTGGHIIMPQGCPWCLPDIHAPVDLTYSVATNPGESRPYLILGDSSTGVNTTFPDAGGPHTPWITKMYVQTVAQESFLISEQWEGNHLHADGTPCGHEKWWFKPGKGLWKVEPLDQGACVDGDPMLNMERIN